MVPALLLAGAAGAAVVVATGPETGLLAPCVVARYTGHLCPFCGGIRCIWRLARLDLVGAGQANALVLAALPVMGAAWLREVRHRWSTGEPWGAWGSLTVPLVLLMTAFWVLRNVPLLEPLLQP